MEVQICNCQRISPKKRKQHVATEKLGHFIFKNLYLTQLQQNLDFPKIPIHSTFSTLIQLIVLFAVLVIISLCLYVRQPFHCIAQTPLFLFSGGLRSLQGNIFYFTFKVSKLHKTLNVKNFFTFMVIHLHTLIFILAYLHIQTRMKKRFLHLNTFLHLVFLQWLQN